MLRTSFHAHAEPWAWHPAQNRTSRDCLMTTDGAGPVPIRRVALYKPTVVAEDPLQHEAVLSTALHAVAPVDRESDPLAFHGGHIGARCAAQFNFRGADDPGALDLHKRHQCFDIFADL